MYKPDKTKKIILSVLVSIFVFIELFSFTLFASPAKTMGPVQITADLPAQIKDIKNTIKDSLTSVALGGLVKAMSTFMNKLAKDTAMYIASGGKGQGAMVFQDGPATYFKKTALSATSGLIDEYSQAFTKMTGVDPNKVASMMTTLSKISSDPMAALKNGDLSDIASSLSPVPLNLASLEQTYGMGGSAQASLTFLQSIKNGGSLGTLTQLGQNIGKEAAEQVQGAVSSRSDLGFKPATTLISGIIKTPATTIQEEAKALTSKNQGDLNAQQVAGIYGNATLKTIPTAMMTFLSTLTSELMKKIMSGDWFDEAKKLSTNYKGSTDSFYSQFIINNRNRAQASFSFLFKVPVRDTSEYGELITQLANCDTGEKPVRSVNNCVIDTHFMDILNKASNGSPMSIREVLDSDEYKNVMNKPFISPARVGDNASDNCAEKGYCYYNMQKLRKLRIVPLGFEIAAKVADADNLENWTLKKVVDGFYDCNQDGRRDATHPYCHLIDPNWILKAPSVRCEAQVYGATLARDGSNIRISECVDFSTKVSEKVDNYYSYCTREKNVWSFEAETCDSQYSTCGEYTNTQDKTSSFYLSRTLDYGECDENAVGCLAYSTEKNPDNTWQNSSQVNSLEKISGRSGTIYFNDNVQTCDQSSAGCNEFEMATLLDDSYGNSSNNVYFKKAPDYLGCYDLNPNTLEIDYPKTSIELDQMIDKPATCSSGQYSQICIENEVGCKKYSLVNASSDTNPDVPGIIGNNSCPAECVGYETYRQLETEFAPTEFPLYFIPSEADSCISENVGCDEFTNIDILEKGGESLQYYTSLRRCELPTGENEKPFYSWQGSSESGYVLKVHRLRPIDGRDIAYINGLFGLDSKVKDAFEEGSPAYFDDYKESLEESYEACNANVYNADALPNTEEDFCRALYDKKGNVYYRLLKKTVTVSESCQPLRKTESLVEVDEYIGDEQTCNIKSGVWENDQCKRCYSGGEYEEGVCYYWIIPEESTSCPASANGCREYTGNSGNNIENIFFNSFEGGDIGNWIANEGGSIAPKTEALKVGESSLGITGGTYYKLDSGSLGDSMYEVSFWAKGNNQKLTITLEDGEEELANFTFDSIQNTEKEVSLSSEWRYYKLGPIQVNNIPTEGEIKLVISANNSNLYFIDNFALNRVQDVIYKIKNSWKKDYENDGYTGITAVPFTCDDGPSDAYPGKYLGCKAYRDQTTSDLTGRESLAYATGFEKLCREGAVGCTAVYDTYNSSKSVIEVYNAECRIVAAGVSLPQTCSVDVNGSKYECELINGESSCLISGPIELSSDFEFEKCYLLGDEKCIVAAPRVVVNSFKSYLSISDSTVIVPADTPVESPLFLTYTRDSKCEESKKGCQELAQEEKAVENGNQDKFTFPNVVYYLNQPDTYLGANGTGILCSSATAGCSSFVNDEGTTEYFKDPKVLGNVLCEYLESNNNEDGNSGWYMTGVGRCGGSQTGGLCVGDSDCDTGVTCNLDTRVPCYSNYQKIDGSYGIWSNDSNGYSGLVGKCPEDQVGCIELKDPQDKSQFDPEGKSYYIYKNNLSDMKSNCNGMVNLVEGCVLFDRTDDPTKLFNSALTYEKSYVAGESSTGYKSVLPDTSGTRDTNLVLQVTRDRECGEWLSCRTSVEVKDENNKIYNVCSDYEVCQQMDDNGNCNSSVVADGDILNEDKYVSRGVEWEDWDYIGYSLLDRKHISLFDTSNIGTNNEFVLTNDGTNVTTTAICKAFPEESSPFDPSLVLRTDARELKTEINGRVFRRFLFNDDTKQNLRFTRYNEANICQSGDCGCAYTKAEYQDGATIDYWPVASKSSIPSGVCSGGKDNDGKPCESDADCVEEASICSYLSKKSNFYGTKGFCLEYDKSRPLSDKSSGNTGYPCTTWLPFDIPVSSVDTYYSDPKPGYVPGLDTVEGNIGEVFCTESTQGYLYDKRNYNQGHVESNFDVTSSSLIINNYTSEDIGLIPNNLEGNTTTPRSFMADWFYSNIQNMMWKKVGSTATVFFSRIPLNVFAGYAPDDEHDKTGGFTFGKNDENLFNPDGDGWTAPGYYKVIFPYPQQMPDYSETVLVEGGLYNDLSSEGFRGGSSRLRFVLGDQYPISLDDIRSLYLSPVLFKKKSVKTNYGYFDTQDGTDSDNRGFTLFEKVKIDVETMKNVYESRTLGDESYYNKEKTFTVEDLNKDYPDFSKTNFIYLYSGYGDDEGAVNYPTDGEFPGGGGKMHTFHFYGENKEDNSIRMGIIIDTSDPWDYYGDTEYKDSIDGNTSCLIDKDTVDGKDKKSVYDIVETAVNTSGTLTENMIYGGTPEKGRVGNFVKELRTNSEDDDVSTFKYKEYAIIMFKFNKGSDGKNYLENYEPLIGGIFRNDNDGDMNYQHGMKKFLYGLTMSVTADLKAKCTEFDVVHEDLDSATDRQLNKAWTDRVWIEAQKKNGQTYKLPNFSNFNLFNYNKDGGSLYGVLPGLDADVVKKITGETRASALDILTTYYFTSPESAGYPLTCSDPLAAWNKVQSNIVDMRRSVAGSYCDSLLISLDSEPYQTVFEKVKDNKGEDGKPVLKNLFAKVFALAGRGFDNIYSYNINYKISDESSEVVAWDEAESLSIENKLLPPQIYSIDVDKCKTGACIADKKDDFTINDIGYNEAACINPYTCEKDPIIGIGSYTAKAKFFVFADTNKMPIKSIKIDWGDSKGIYNDGMVGFYPNQKPVCGVQKHCFVGEKDTQLTCETNTDCTNLGAGAECKETGLGRISFGDSDRACKEGYKTVTYHYTCKKTDTNSKTWDEIQGSLNTLEKSALAAKGYPAEGAEYCVYKPKIQVKDNWGWCNGSCDGENGCYESDCSNSNSDAWTSYPKNIIIVAN